MMFWSQISYVAQELRHTHAGIEELYMLLKEKLGGVVFSKKETAMLFQPGLPVRERMKICFLVDKVKEHCKGFASAVLPIPPMPTIVTTGTEPAFPGQSERKRISASRLTNGVVGPGIWET
jgi:hypothetical protein